MTRSSGTYCAWGTSDSEGPANAQLVIGGGLKLLKFLFDFSLEGVVEAHVGHEAASVRLPRPDLLLTPLVYVAQQVDLTWTVSPRSL